MRALITGGEGDLAREVAAQLAALGWTIDARGREQLDVTREVDASGIEPPDALIHCAGIASWNTGWLAARSQYDVNTLGIMRVTDALVPLMAKGAHIVMVSSELASAPSLPLAAAGYAMSKAAVNVLARAYATTYPHLVVRAVPLRGVRTRMNPGGELSVADGAAAVVSAVLIP